MLTLFIEMQQGPWPLLLFLYSLFFIIGLCIGSFLNVVIYRLPIMLERDWKMEANSILNIEDQQDTPIFNLAVPRSACPVCKSEIKAWQNIPVFSYLFLGGKCNSCKTKISLRYPAIELFTGLITILIFQHFGFTLQFACFLILTYISIALVCIDLDQQILPDILTIPLVWLGLLVNSYGTFVKLSDALYGAVLGYGILWSVFWLFKLITGKDGMGYGDFKLLAAFGAWFGWTILPNTILLSSVMGALVGIVLIKMRGADSQTPIAFGPYIIIAGLLTALYPQYFVLFNYL